MRAMRAIGLAAALLVVPALVPTASAELTLGGMNVEGEVETGLRYFIERPSPSRRAKFEEYRDIPEWLFLQDLRLRIFRPDESYSFEFGGSKWGQEDQEFSIRSGRLGLWEFGFDWDQTPHVFSTNARMRAVETSRGVFTLPSTRPTAATLSPAEGALYNSARELDEISVRWDTARLSLLLTPTPDLEIRAEYSRISKDGDKPFSMAFGSPGNDFMEILEPIEHTIHDFRLRATVAREQWQLQFGYTMSLFENSLKSVLADNPLQATNGAFASNSSAPATGRVSLAPDNMAHTFTLAGGVNLPMRTRLTANVSYSLRLQDDDFLPHTVNPNITSALLALPQDSLDGVVGTTLFNLNLTSRPVRPLTLSLKYRLFDYDDMSDEPLFPAHVVNDRTLVVEERKAGRIEYTRHNLDLDGRIRLIQPLSVTLGGGWERWDRNEHREVPTSDELFAKAALDWTPFDWLLARLTYRPSFRRVDKYDTFAHLSHTVVEELTASDFAQSQSTLLRKFDEGERDRQRVDLLLQFFPLETLAATLTGSWINDDYIDGRFGLRDATTWSAGFDLNWTPVERVAVFGGYTHESIFQKQRSRSRPVTGSTTFDFADFDWISDNTDTVDTFHVGASVALIPRRLDWNVSANYSYALGRIETRNPVAPTSGTAVQQSSATAKRMPAFEDALLRLDTALRYHFLKQWTASLGYAFESFQKNDWRTDRLNPFIPGVSSVWLGNDLRNYDAHIVGLTLRYAFK